MQKLEYTCQQCGHSFKRVVFIRDMPPRQQPCPQCGNAVDPDKYYGDRVRGIIVPNDTN
jgi:putative FmdB family regulatory protein